MICKDCNGSKVYIPFTGPSEPCGRCHGSGNEPCHITGPVIETFAKGCVGEMFLAQAEDSIYYSCLERGQFYFRRYGDRLDNSYRLPDCGISVHDVFHDPRMFVRSVDKISAGAIFTFKELKEGELVLGSQTLCCHCKLLLYHPLDQKHYKVEMMLPVAATGGYSLNQKLHHHGGSLTADYNPNVGYYQLKVML